MPRKSKNPLYIDWGNSAAKKIIVKDMEPGGLLYGNHTISVEEIFDLYKQRLIRRLGGRI